MQFLTSLFGGTGNTILSAILALGIVLVLILLALWGLKILTKASRNVGRGRQRRLTVVDSVAIDAKRQLHIIRRDNVEHLILTGGPQDVIVESGIAVENAGPRLPVRRPAAPMPAQQKPVPEQQKSVPPQPAKIARDERPRASVLPLDRAAPLNRAEPERRAPSLRHTGLMRAVGRLEPEVSFANSDKSGQSLHDSVRTGHLDAGANSRDHISNGQDSGDGDPHRQGEEKRDGR